MNKKTAKLFLDIKWYYMYHIK